MTVTTHHYVDDVLLEELLYFLATSHHVEETDAGLDRPLYLRNKLYDKTLKLQNYYSNILRFPVPSRSASWIIIIRCLLPAGRTAANPPQLYVAAE